MKQKSEQMSSKSKSEYLEHCRKRYERRNREGRSAMINEVSEVMGWGRKHTIKALNGKVSHGKKAQKRGSKSRCSEAERRIIVGIWKASEQPCGMRLKATLPLWLASYAAHHGAIEDEVQKRILSCSGRTLERITLAHRINSEGGKSRGRKTGRASNRIKKFVPIRCGPQAFDGPGWMEADTVSHGGGSSSGDFLWSLTLTDFHSGWTELAALWGNRGGEVRVGLERIERRMPFELLGFDCDNGSEFLNEILEAYLLKRARRVHWTRSRAYKKNDQAHVEQKNFTHVRQLLGYGRFADLRLKNLVDDLYEQAWLPLRNYFTPVMKLVEKQRIAGKVRKTYDQAATPCDRLLACDKVSSRAKAKLRSIRKRLDPLMLAQEIEQRLAEIFTIADEIQDDSWQEISPLAGPPASAAEVADSVPAPLAYARLRSLRLHYVGHLGDTPLPLQKHT
jgi:hypothetical protein